MRKLFFSFFLLNITCCAFAQNNRMSTRTVDTAAVMDDINIDDEKDFAKDVIGDTSVYFNDFSFSRDSIKALKLKKEYGWHTNIDSFLLAQKREDSSLAKIEIKQNSGSSFLGSLFNSGILQVLMWTIVAAFVLFIIYKLFLSEGVFGKRAAKARINVETNQEDTSLLNDYDTLLRQAYNTGNWRFAMRFLFLKTLQKLQEKGLINYAVDKTNSVYVNELPVAQRNEFAALALYYEYVWYGNVEIEKDIFDEIENKFNSYLNKV